MLRTFLFVFLLLILYTAQDVLAQGSFVITNGNLTVKGSPYIVLNDINWVNNGQFDADSSTVVLVGNTASQISGTSNSSFWAVILNKATAQVALNSPIEINDSLYFQAGLLDLNGQTLILDTLHGGLSGESEISRIIGATGGEVVKVITLTAPNDVNPGNLGIHITATGTPGVSSVKRGHIPQTLPFGSSIARYFEIVPTQNSGLNSTIRFTYFDAEVNGLGESELELFSGNVGGGGMNPSGFATRDGVSNFVTQSGLDGFGRFTLSTIGTFPVEWLGFDAWPVEGQVQTQWVTASELNSDYFEVQRSQDGDWFEDVTQVAAAGNSQEILTYEAIDPTPYLGRSYYRVKQVDQDGTFSYSPTVSVMLAAEGSLSLFPNPTDERVTIDYDSRLSGPAEVVISDLRGRKVLTQTYSLDIGRHQIPLDVSRLGEGVYTVQVSQGTARYSLRLMVE